MPQVWEPEASRGSHVPFITKYHYQILVLILAIGTFTAFGPRPEGLSLEGQRALGIFVLCALLWVTSVIPLQITSILALTLLPMIGALPERDGISPAEQAFRLFGNEAVFFILGAFILSAVLVKCGLSTRLTSIVLHTFSRSATQLRNAIFLFCAFFSCFMSEHAVAAMFFPIVPGREEDSWAQLNAEGLEHFFNGTFAREYQSLLLAAFDEALPENPPWQS